MSDDRAQTPSPSCRNEGKSQQRRLVLVGVTPSVQDVFKISKLTNFFVIHDCVEDVV